MTAKYSPTILSNYKDNNWWVKNGGGLGSAKDGSPMNIRYHRYDHDGYDQFGFDARGIDRAGYTQQDYENDEQLFSSVVERTNKSFSSANTNSDFWNIISHLRDAMASACPELEIYDPQDVIETNSHIAVKKDKGVYSLSLNVSQRSGAHREFRVSLNNGDGGSSLFDPEFTATIDSIINGDRNTEVYAFIPSAAALISIIKTEFSKFDPGLYDVVLYEEEQKPALKIRSRLETLDENDEKISTVYAESKMNALFEYRNKTKQGGVLRKLSDEAIARHQDDRDNNFQRLIENSVFYDQSGLRF